MLAFLLTVVFLVMVGGLRIVQQYERGVVFRLGKVTGEKAPGLRLIIPIIDKMQKVNMRVITMPIVSQKIITKDNVSIDVAAVAYFRIVNATKSIVEIDNVVNAVNQIAQTTVRNIAGQFSLDEVLSNTNIINQRIRDMIDIQTEPWGILVSVIEIKDIKLPESMQRAMAKQAEAEREKRSKIIAAEGELAAVANLTKAAEEIAKHPVALQLRNLQVLSEIAVEKNSTIVFPAEFFSTVKDAIQRIAK